MAKPKTQTVKAYPPALKGGPSATSPVPGTEAWIMAQVKRAKKFADTEAFTAEPDSDWLRAKNLIGVTLCIVAVDIAPKAYENNEPKLTATFSFYLAERPDIGLRKMDLQNKQALAQAQAFTQYDFPCVCCVELDDPKKGQWAAAVLSSAREQSAPYFHKPWGESAQENAPVYVDATTGASESEDSPF